MRRTDYPEQRRLHRRHPARVWRDANSRCGERHQVLSMRLHKDGRQPLWGRR